MFLNGLAHVNTQDSIHCSNLTSDVFPNLLKCNALWIMVIFFLLSQNTSLSRTPQNESSASGVGLGLRKLTKVTLK